MASIRPLLHEGFSWVKRETNIPKADYESSEITQGEQ